MDRNLAMALLAFDRPGGAGDLTPADRAALAAAVAADPTMADYARRAAAEDSALGTAMRAVVVPPSAKSRVLARLTARRACKLRRARLTLAGSAAAVLLAGGVGVGVVHSLRPALDGYDLAVANERAVEAPERTVRDFLAARGLPAGPPLDLNFGHYLTHGTERIDGRDVPVVTFVRPRQGGGFDFLKLYAVTGRQFRLDGLTDAQASLCTAHVYDDDRAPGVRWVAVSTTVTVEPFLRPPAPGA